MHHTGCYLTHPRSILKAVLKREHFRRAFLALLLLFAQSAYTQPDEDTEEKLVLSASPADSDLRGAEDTVEITLSLSAEGGSLAELLDKDTFDIDLYLLSQDHIALAKQVKVGNLRSRSSRRQTLGIGIEEATLKFDGTSSTLLEIKHRNQSFDAEVVTLEFSAATTSRVVTVGIGNAEVQKATLVLIAAYEGKGKYFLGIKDRAVEYQGTNSKCRDFDDEEDGENGGDSGGEGDEDLGEGCVATIDVVPDVEFIPALNVGRGISDEFKNAVSSRISGAVAHSIMPPSGEEAYVLVPGIGEYTPIDATAWLEDGFLASSLYACIMEWDGADPMPMFSACSDENSKRLDEDTTVSAPLFRSVLYWFVKIVGEKFQRGAGHPGLIYVAPQIGFATSVWVYQPGASEVVLPLRAGVSSAATPVVTLGFKDDVPFSSTVVSFSGRKGEFRQPLPLQPPRWTIELSMINGIAFGRGGEGLSEVEVGVMKIEDEELFALGNNKITLIRKEAPANPIASSSTGVLMGRFVEQAEIDLDGDYSVSVYKYRPETGTLEDIFEDIFEDSQLCQSSSVQTVEISTIGIRKGVELDGCLIPADPDDEDDLQLFEVVISSTSTSGEETKVTSIRLMGVEPGREPEMLPGDQAFELVTPGAKAWTGFYAYKQQEEGVRSTHLITTNTLLGIKSLPDGTEVGKVETGVFDFVVRDLAPGGVATVRIKLLKEVQAYSVYHKYDDRNAGWKRFDGNNGDHPYDRVFSAPTVNDQCPSAGARRQLDEGSASDGYAWRLAHNGVLEGDECLLLEIQDGGPNDADGAENGVIFDAGALSAVPDGGGSGAMNAIWLILLAAGMASGMALRKCKPDCVRGRGG